jgi:membrane-associated HD superfamily phosphohydrolase
MSARNEFTQNFKYTILLIGVSSIAAYFIFGKAVTISIILGGATMLWGMSLLAKNHRKMTKDNPRVSGRVIGLILRYTLYVIVLGLSYYMETLNIYGTFFGLLTFKIALYSQAIWQTIRGGNHHE